MPTRDDGKDRGDWTWAFFEVGVLFCVIVFIIDSVDERWFGVTLDGRLIATVALLLAVLNAVVSFRWRRRKRREERERRRMEALLAGRCPGCGYPTAGLPAPRCPECGGSLEQSGPAARPQSSTSPGAK